MFPLKPRRWPFIRARKWYGDFPFDVEYTVAGNTQRLAVGFPEALPTDVHLRVSLPLRRPHAVHPPHLRNDLGERNLTDWQVEDRPCRISFQLDARAYQEITLRT